jgi:hypothetical protein
MVICRDSVGGVACAGPWWNGRGPEDTNMNATKTLALLGVGSLLAMAMPAAAQDPFISVPDPTFAVTGSQALATDLQGAATGFATAVSDGATNYAAGVPGACAVPAEPGPPSCSGAFLPTDELFALPTQAGAFQGAVVAAAATFAVTGIATNAGDIVATKGQQAQDVAAAIAQGIPAFNQAAGMVLDSVNGHVCDTGTLGVPSGDPGVPSTAGLCGASTFVGQVRGTAGVAYAGAVGVLQVTTLTPFCDSFNAAAGKIGPAPRDPLPCSSLPQGSDVAGKLPPAP